MFVCLWWLLLLFERPPLFAFLPHLLVNLVYICGVSGDDDDDVAHFWSSSVVVAPVQCTVSASPWPRMYVSLCVCVCVCLYLCISERLCVWFLSMKFMNASAYLAELHTCSPGSPPFGLAFWLAAPL